MTGWLHEVTVRAQLVGRVALTFPLDMLRYDMLAPRDSQSLDVIQASISGEEEECYCPKEPDRWPTVKLVRQADRHWTPTAARWSSFGWEVISHTKRKL
jgi:hypothetical protein